MATDTPGRRWYQFSLLTMLFVVGLLVVLAAMSFHHHYWGRHLSFNPRIAEELSGDAFERIFETETTYGFTYHGSNDEYHFIHHHDTLNYSRKNYKVRRAGVGISDEFAVGEGTSYLLWGRHIEWNYRRDD